METTFNQTTVSRFCVNALHKPDFYGIKNGIKMKTIQTKSNKNEANQKSKTLFPQKSLQNFC